MANQGLASMVVNALKGKGKRRRKRRRKPLPRRELAFEMGRWDRYSWRRALEQLGVEHEHIEKWQEKRPAWPLLARELFGRLYTGDELDPAENPVQWAQMVHEAADDLPEFARLLDLCRDERIESGVAAVALARQLDDVIPPDETGEGGDSYDDDDEGEGSGGSSGGSTGATGDDESDDEGDGDGQGDGDSNGQQQPDEGDSDGNDSDSDGSGGGPSKSLIRQALREACEQLADDADQREAAMSALGVGWGNEPGSATVRANHDQMVELAKRLREDRRLREIAELAGRFEAIARKKKVDSVDSTGAELVDVTLGSDPMMLLPTEFARLRRRASRLDLLRRLTTGAAMTYEVQADEWKGRGPMVIAIDASGSMSGDRDRWAKAVALALRNTAAQERRPAHIIVFDTRIMGEYTENGDVMALLNVIDLQPSGGTDWMKPIDRGVALIEQETEFRDADVVLITDGECDVRDEWLDNWNKWREQHKASCIGVLINERHSYYGRSDGKSLEKIADNVIKVDLDEDAIGAAERVIEVTI